MNDGAAATQNDPDADVSFRFLKRRWYEKPYLSWCSSLIYKSFNEEISADDLWHLDDTLSSEKCGEELEHNWRMECKLPVHEQSFQRVLRRTYLKRYSEGSIFFALWFAATLFSSAYLLRSILSILSNPGSPTTLVFGVNIPLEALVYSLCFIVSESLRSVFIARMWFVSVCTGLAAAAATRAMLFRKAVCLVPGQIAVGEVVNIVSTDGQRLTQAATYGWFLVGSPLVVLIVIVIMLLVLGPSILAGFAVLLVLIPVQVRNLWCSICSVY